MTTAHHHQIWTSPNFLCRPDRLVESKLFDDVEVGNTTDTESGLSLADEHENTSRDEAKWSRCKCAAYLITLFFALMIGLPLSIMALNYPFKQYHRAGRGNAKPPYHPLSTVPSMQDRTTKSTWLQALLTSRSVTDATLVTALPHIQEKWLLLQWKRWGLAGNVYCVHAVQVQRCTSHIGLAILSWVIVILMVQQLSFPSYHTYHHHRIEPGYVS